MMIAPLAPAQAWLGAGAEPRERHNVSNDFPMKIGLLELLMGVETPIPPKMITPSPLTGRPRGGFNPLFSRKPDLPRRAP